MHASVMAWVGEVLNQADIKGRAVLEVGSYNVNGTVRPLVEALEPASYLGVDQIPGPGVDETWPAEQLADVLPSFDVVISTEMLEHARDWRACLVSMTKVLAPDGLLLLTTRSPGFPYHPYPEDHWRFPVPLMAEIIEALGLEPLEVCADPDPASPGVFVKARKPQVWARPLAPWLDELEAEPAPIR